MSLTEPHFSSPYPVGEPNEPIPIGHEELALVKEGEWLAGNGLAQVKCLPRPSLEIIGSFPRANLCLADNGEDALGMPSRGLVVPGFITSFSTTINAEGSASTLEWTVSPQHLVVTGDETTEVSKVLFQVANCVDFYCQHPTCETVDGASHTINSVYLNWEDLGIHIRSLPSTSKSIKNLRTQGGFGVTHLGELIHRNGGSIAVREINSFLKALRLFLSFCRGAWSSPILPTGYDASGHLVWECWNSPNGESYIYTHSWVEKLIGAHQMEAVFPGFMNLWSDEAWQDAVNEAIYWYLNSNYSPRGIDAGIILTQTAIERLCFTYSVEKHHYLSLDGFNKLSAADRFRLLFAALDIPQDIPAILHETTKLSKAHSWADAPQALTEIRNEKVHPQHKKRGMFDEALYEAWTLGLWYVEMIILRLCGYTGQYANRLVSRRSPGQVEKVPWVS